MTVQVGDIIRIACKWAFAGDEFVNVHHLEVQAVPAGSYTDYGFMTAVASILDTSWYSEVVDSFPNTLVATTITGKNVSQDVILPEVAWGSDGTADEEALPSQTSAEVVLNTAKPRTSGRVFLPPFTEAGQSAGGSWGSSTLAELVSFGAALLTAWYFGDFGFSRIVYDAVHSTFVYPSAATVPGRARTQRRRRVGLGS